MFRLRHILFSLLAFCSVACVAQTTQVIRGRVVDKDSKAPLFGVVVAVKDSIRLSATTDTNGRYVIKGVPLGKHTIITTYIGYLDATIPEVLVTSGREVVLPIELEESANELKTVSITAKREHINEMALVSAKTFDVQEVERFPGSRADIGRMVSNFAGVQGGDDSRNDIIVRGNSPQGVLWRLEGIDIPNPNHFNVPGTTGGPVTILNENTLANTDFFTGAFPAEYGDAVGGVFDVRLRNGNSDKCEFTGQLGLLGTEIVGEGPISKKAGSSFLFTYRYSTLQIFQGLHINVGTTSIPKYQDATFKLHFPVGKKADISIFGVGGLSSIDLVVSNLTTYQPQIYGQSDRDQYFTSNMGVAGASFNYTFNRSTYMRFVVGETGSLVKVHHNYVFRDITFNVDSLKPILGYNYKIASTVAHWFINKKFSPRHLLQIGLINNLYYVNLIDSTREYPVTRQDWQYQTNYIGYTDLIQAYAQYKYRPSDNVVITAGIHGQYLTHNSSKAIEPRASVKWILDNRNSVSLGYGLHSEMLPLYEYFSFAPNDNNPNAMPNYNIGFIRSHHIVAGFYHNFSNTLTLSTEAYYQYLFDVPIETTPGSSFTVLDEGSTYERTFPDSLKNTGTGYNYGLELTLQKTFSHGYYFMFTGSLFNSMAKGNDGVYRSTDYNSHFDVNFLFGYEHKVWKKSTFFSGLKVTWQGGKLYSPPDIAATNATGYYTIYDSLRNTLQFKPYFRLDLKLGIRINGKKLTHEIAVDLINVLGTKNILSMDYSSFLAEQGSSYPFYTEYQLGFLPIFYYKVDF